MNELQVRETRHINEVICWCRGILDSREDVLIVRYCAR